MQIGQISNYLSYMQSKQRSVSEELLMAEQQVKNLGFPHDEIP